MSGSREGAFAASATNIKQASAGNTLPKWFDNSTNGTTAGTNVEHSVRWTDDTALSGYIFSFDNGTGTFTNDSFVAMSGAEDWSNVSKVVNSTVGSTIRWIVYANDSANQFNATDIFSYTTTAAAKSGLIPTTVGAKPFYTNESNPRNITLNQDQSQLVVFWVNATGSINSINEFFAYANKTSDMSISNITSTWNVTIKSAVANQAPTITFVEDIVDITPNEGGVNSTTFNFTVTDTNGFADINVSSAQARFQLTGETTRLNTSCVSYQSRGNQVNFTCTIGMYYFDKADNSWIINITVKDNSDASGENSSTNVQFNELKAMVMSPAVLSWPQINLTNTNIGSNNDPIVVNNTGNAKSLSINVTGLNLQGETIDTQFIFAANITVQNISQGCSGTQMSNATSLNVTSIILQKGNNSLNYNNATSGQEELFFCVTAVNSDLSAQSYSSAAYGAWEIRILLVIAGIPARRKKKKQITENLVIPATIFSNKLGALESITKYLRENMGISSHLIAELFNREQRTICTAYKKAIEKQKDP